MDHVRCASLVYVAVQHEPKYRQLGRAIKPFGVLQRNLGAAF